MNSELKVDDSTMFLRLENPIIETLLTSIMIPVYERLVHLHPAWSVSTKHVVLTILPCTLAHLKV